MNNSSYIIGAYLLVSFAFASCSNNNEEEVVTETKTEGFCITEKFKPQVKWAPVSEANIIEEIPFIGTVQSNPDRVIQFVSLVDGIVDEIHFSLGEEVKKGQLLAEIRSSELSQLQSDKTSLEAELKVAEQQLKATQSMYDDGISSQGELLQSQSNFNSVQANINRVNSVLSLYSASTEKGVFQIRAAEAGVITAKNITEGKQISAGNEVLFTISDLSEVWVVMNVFAGNVTKVFEEMPVDIRTTSYPDQVFKGNVSAISKVFDSEERVLKARIVLENEDFKLKPGMLVDITGSDEQTQKAIAVSSNSLIFDNNQNYVVEYKSDCYLQIHPVEVLAKNKDTYYLSTALKAGAQVITENQLLIYQQVLSSQRK